MKEGRGELLSDIEGRLRWSGLIRAVMRVSRHNDEAVTPEKKIRIELDWKDLSGALR